MRPEIVVQVAFIEWTVHGKLRHPRLLGVRTDKPPRDVVQGDAVITHPEKVLFPDDGITKGELAAYYEAIAPVMLPHIRGRPVTMERYPGRHRREGLLAEGRVEGVSRLARARRGAEEGRHRAPSARHRHALAALARQPEQITPHVWTSRVPDLYQPDICVFDLDPSEDEPDVLRAAALALRDLLDELGLPSWVKTSGSKGFHIVVPLDGKAGLRRGRAVRARASARVLVQRDPEHLTQEFSKADRGGRILVDTGRNGYSATFAAAYAVRAEARRAGVGAVHVGGGRARRGRPADVHAADHGRTRRRGRRSVGRHRRRGRSLRRPLEQLSKL